MPQAEDVPGEQVDTTGAVDVTVAVTPEKSAVPPETMCTSAALSSFMMFHSLVEVPHRDVSNMTQHQRERN
jgi:hypothetical protein